MNVKNILFYNRTAKKPYFLYNGVTQLFRKYGFEIFDPREFGVIECLCTSSVLNIERPKAQLKEHTID